MKASQPELCHKIIREEHRERDGERQSRRGKELARENSWWASVLWLCRVRFCGCGTPADVNNKKHIKQHFLSFRNENETIPSFHFGLGHKYKLAHTHKHTETHRDIHNKYAIAAMQQSVTSTATLWHLGSCTTWRAAATAHLEKCTLHLNRH